jgi:hypothetical protein
MKPLRSMFRSAARRRPFSSGALALAVLALGAAGCDTYHYYDMDLMFGSDFGGAANVGMAQLCRVDISGADSHEFTLDACGLLSGTSNIQNVGIFEFATFADSGTLTFTVDAYNGTPPTPTCLFGVGTTSLPASSQVTTTGTITIEPMGTGCPNPGN